MLRVLLTACGNGTFGIHCLEECHCLYDSCDPVNGTCDLDKCAQGWEGFTCSEGTLKSNNLAYADF